MPNKGTVAGPGFVWTAPGNGGNDDVPRLGLPGVDDDTLAASDVLVVPVPSLWVDQLADSTNNP